MTYSYPKVTKCYPNVNYSSLKVTNSYPKVTYSEPKVTLHTSPYLHLPHLTKTWPLVK